jgi:hypothetical protein
MRDSCDAPMVIRESHEPESLATAVSLWLVVSAIALLKDGASAVAGHDEAGDRGGEIGEFFMKLWKSGRATRIMTCHETHMYSGLRWT